MARSKRSTFDEDMRKIVSLKLGIALQRKGWTKTMLSDKTGISSSTLSGYFTGKYNISEENLNKISTALEVSPSEIDPRADVSKYTSIKSDDSAFTSLVLNF